MHLLLQRQLKRIGVDAADLANLPPGWTQLLERVSKTYLDHDQERYLLERTQDLASREMSELNATLRQERDLLDQRVRERTTELQLSEDRLQSLLSLSADWIWEQDSCLQFTFFSEGLETTTGVTPESLVGQSALHSELFHAENSDRPHYATCLAARQPFRDFKFTITLEGGAQRFVRLSGEPVLGDQGQFFGYRGVGRDVTEATLAQRKVQELASIDMLTGLPNRTMFLAELELALARARRASSSFSVAFIDLDRFKNINDTLGHGAGDELLRAMAKRLRSTLRAQNVIARFGGDEFVVLLEGGSGVEVLNTVGEKLLAAVSQPINLEDSHFITTGSVGISRYPEDAQNAGDLLKQADAAMYLAKQRGRNNVQFYTSELAQRAAYELSLEGELRQALEGDGLRLHFQPKVELASGRILGAEALVRWHHPQRGLVSPADFIPLAEERGLIVPLGRWVMQAACASIHRWREQGLAVPPVAVNLSARQFSSESLVPDLLEAMSMYGVRGDELEVELTESALMSDPERANAVLGQLKQMGLSVAIDDFGTGYSSLAYLKRLPASTVKLDRNFVRGLPDDRDDVAITQAVIALAHSLQLRVVAEGVETDSQLDFLRTLGCDEAQGFLLGRPMTAEEFATHLRLHSGWNDKPQD